MTTIKRRTFLAGASATAAGLLAAEAASAAPAVAADSAPFGVPSVQQKNYDPAYGVYRGTDPDIYNDWGIERDDKVLVYSRTAGPRHAHLGRTLDPDHPSNAGLGLHRPYVITHDHTDTSMWPLPLNDSNVSQREFVRMLRAEGIEVHISEDVQAIERLSNSYKAVVFNSPTRDTLWNHAAGAEGGTRLDRARESLRKFMHGGGGFVGIHNAHGTEYNGWKYYEGLLGNSNYYNHGQYQDGDVVVINDRDASTKDLPERWAFRDEWYNLVPFPNHVNFLAVGDESTFPNGGGSSSHPGHGDFHPVSWCHYYDGGRCWITTLGHHATAYQENSSHPGAAEFQAHIVSGIKSAMGLEPFCTPAKG